jgi:hypothetical protein
MKTNNSYYQMYHTHAKITISTYPDEKYFNGKLYFEFSSKLEGKNILPFELPVLKFYAKSNKLVHDPDLSDIPHEKIWVDYLHCQWQWPTMSEKMRGIIEKNTTEAEGIDWISCNVNAMGEIKEYYIMRFNKLLDVLDLTKPLTLSGKPYNREAPLDSNEAEVTVQCPIYSYEKVKKYNIFFCPRIENSWKISSSSIYISAKLRLALIKAGITGPSYEKILPYTGTKTLAPRMAL